MRFSIKDLVRDVENYKIMRDRYNDLLIESKKPPSFIRFWEKRVTKLEVKNAFEDYMKSMQRLERKYNKNYHNLLEKQAIYNIKPSAPPYDEMIV